MIYFWFILGAVVGSFLNVCICRLPRGESIVFPPSHCPGCGKKLSPLDLIPILGYFLLLGKCRYCRARISPRYPLVEFLTASAFAFSWQFTAGNPMDLIFYLIFISVLIVIFFIDLELQVIPDAASVAGILSGLAYNFLRGIVFYKGLDLNPFLSALFGMILGYALLYAIGKIGGLWFKKEVMGEGDLFLAALLGANLGWTGVLLSVFLAYIIAAASVLPLLAVKRIKFGQYIPFGPALAAAGAITLFWGERILLWYWGLFI